MAIKIGNFDPRISGITDDFVVARAAELFEAGRPAAERADSAVDASSIIAQGWLAEVAAERGVRADSLAGGLAQRVPPRRADAAYYNSGDDLSAPLRPEPFVKQQKPRALLSGLPVQTIGAGQMRFYANFLDHVGSASLYTPGTNVIATADIDRSQDEARDVFTYVVQVPEDWLLNRMDQFAGRDNTSQRQLATTRCRWPVRRRSEPSGSTPPPPTAPTPRTTSSRTCTSRARPSARSPRARSTARIPSW